MKDYMASGSCSGQGAKQANKPMVFVGNINQSVDAPSKTFHLFEPLPEAMANDTAFLTGCTTTCPAGKYRRCGPSFLLMGTDS